MCSVSSYFWWIMLIFLDVFPDTKSAWLRCYKGSLDKYLVTPLTDPLLIASPSCVDPSLTTVIYAFGFTGRADGPATKTIIDAYIGTKKRNVILLDWEEEAKSGMFGISVSYVIYAVPNAKKIGQQLGSALTTLSQLGMNMTEVHLLGHSMGAHIMAYAGREVRANGYTVARITGLDPARTFVEGQFTLLTGLDRTCAKFVDIIHTDPGGYGTSAPTGTVDIWPNYIGKGSIQPGCPIGNFNMFDREDLCSHDRAWQYFVESISSPTAFPAVSAKDYENWVTSGDQTRQTIYMGDLIDRRALGSFFLTTDPKSPFGKKQQGMRPDERRHLDPVQTTRYTRLLSFL